MDLQKRKVVACRVRATAVEVRGYDSPPHSIKTHPGPPKSNISSLTFPQYRRNMTKANPKTLDGCTLEGGGQLIRIAVALSAITGQPVIINDIRGNRGKKGLKGSHLAAIQFLASISGSTVQGAELGSTCLEFYPPASGAKIDVPVAIPAGREYNIKLDSPGSIFLVLQAVYPYLLHAGYLAGMVDPIRLNLTGGTNVSFSPSVDYIIQVLGPNLRRLGLPILEFELHKRGWMTGPKDLGIVSVFVHPLVSSGEKGVGYGFPSINLNNHHRGGITQIDVTILAPDDSVSQNMTLRKIIEREAIHALKRRISGLPSTTFQTNPKQPSVSKADNIPIHIHTSEQTRHSTHVYILLVGHTSNGFRIGRHALLGETKGMSSRAKHKHKHHNRSKSVKYSENDKLSHILTLIQKCIDDFLGEFHDPNLAQEEGKHRPCVDEYLRDQLVIFEALGRVSLPRNEPEGHSPSIEDGRNWSLHMQTARWVCERILGVEW